MNLYSEKMFENDFCRKAAILWQKQKLISSQQLDKILTLYPEEGVRTSPVLRLLNFIFTSFCVGAAFGLLQWILGYHIWKDRHLLAFLSIGTGVFCYVLAEASVKIKNFFRFGVEEALVVSSGFFLCFGISSLLSSELFSLTGRPITIVTSLVAVFFCLWTHRRFGLLYMKLGVLIALAVFIFSFELSPNIERALSFALFGLLLISRFLAPNPPFFEEQSQSVYEGALALAAYLSLHMKLESLSYHYFLNPISYGSPSAPRGVFYYSTFAAIALIPVILLVIGIRRRRRSFLISGIITALLTLMTWKPYLGLERRLWDPMIFGIFLIGISSLISKWLSKGMDQARGVWTARKILSREFLGKDFEALSTLSTVSVSSHIPNSGTQPDFSGGSSGGGGASQGF